MMFVKSTKFTFCLLFLFTSSLAQFENTDSDDDDDEEDDEIEFGQLKIVVGKVLDLMTHSHEDSHYVMKVDIAGHPAKYMISQIAHLIPREFIKGRLLIFLVNLRQTMVHGCPSDGAPFVADDGSRVELLKPPYGSVFGDIIYVPGYEYLPDINLNPKVVEKFTRDMFLNENKTALYRNIPWTVNNKGPVTTQWLYNASIKIM